MARIAARLKAKANRDKTRPRDSAFLKKARERFKLANDADAEQSERERDDIAFEDGEQWPADVKLARQGQQPINGMPAVPARPTLVINKIKEPIRQILNQERAADLGVEITAADDFGELGVVIDDTEIRLREGLVRRIQRESHASDARTWAYKRAVIAGRGYYLVMTRFLPGKTFDQEIYLHRIYNQSGVKLDPAHEQPDGSDAEWGFIGTWMPWDKYKSLYPTVAGKDNPYCDYSEADFMGLTEDYPDWYEQTTTEVTKDGKKDTVRGQGVRIVDYWYLERTMRELAILDDGSCVWLDDVPKNVKPADTRQEPEVTIKFCKIGGGLQILEETDWAGPDMPIVKVLGDEVLPYDNQRRAEGMVRPSRSAQMGENYMISKLVETIGLTPLSPLQVDPEAIDGYENWYKVANIRPLPYLPSRTYNDQGQKLDAPHRPAVDPNIFPMAQAINLFDQFIRSTTAVPDPTLGNVDPSLKSGKAIGALTANAAQSTSNFLDNLARSIRYEGQIINNLLYPIYGQKHGRRVRILTGENVAQTIHVGPPDPSAQPDAKALARAVLTQDAHFNVAIKVTKEYDTKRQETAAFLGNIIAAEPGQMGVVGDLLYRNIDTPGHNDMADRQRVMLAPPVQAFLASKEQGGAISPQAQAQISHLTQQLQQATQIIQELGPKAQGKQLESDTKIQIETMRQKSTVLSEAAETLRTEAENETKIAVAELGAKMDRLSLFLEERARLGVQAHEGAMAAADAGAASDLSAQEHGQTLQQGAQQAVLQPPPAQPDSAAP